MPWWSRDAAEEPSQPPAEVDVPGVLEVCETATFDLGDEQVYLVGPDSGRLGDVVHESHPAARAHPELFRPLRLSLGLRHELVRDSHPAGHAQPAMARAAELPAGARERLVADRLNEAWRQASGG